MDIPTSPARHTVSIRRMPGMTWKSKNSLGNDAKHAVMFLPGAFSVEVLSETADVAVVRYEWHSPQPCTTAAEIFARRGLLALDRL